jgi:diguanylate cyclase (GGDEF)-like protein/PAS domain S-box-containing protein
MVFAFYLFYQAFFEAGIQKPVQVLSEELDRSREEVRREQDFVATILDTSYALLMVLDDQGRILRFNQALSQNSGLPAGRIEGLPIWENGLFSETKEQIEEIYARLPGDASPFRYDSHLRSLDNRNIHIAWSISAHFAADQTIEYSVWTGIDISDRVQAEDELRYLSTHDTLTGLYNRAFFEAEMIRLAETDRFPASIVIADVDGLKRINDNFGHMVGDKLIQRAAHILRSAFRAEDVVARMGGDEFAVLLPDADEAVLLHCQRRVAAIMAAHNQVSPDSPISISLGGATSPDGYVLMETYKKADQAMYHQKALSHARQKAE